MTEQELKDKIVADIIPIIETADEFMIIKTMSEKPSARKVAERIADALIAAGLKFDTIVSHTATFDTMQQDRINELEKRIAEAEHRAARAEHELERRLAEATKAMYVYERALYYATLNGETADEVKYNDALKRAQKDFAENKGD